MAPKSVQHTVDNLPGARRSAADWADSSPEVSDNDADQNDDEPNDSEFDADSNEHSEDNEESADEESGGSDNEYSEESDDVDAMEIEDEDDDDEGADEEDLLERGEAAEELESDMEEYLDATTNTIKNKKKANYKKETPQEKAAKIRDTDEFRQNRVTFQNAMGAICNKYGNITPEERRRDNVIDVSKGSELKDKRHKYGAPLFQGHRVRHEYEEWVGLGGCWIHDGETWINVTDDADTEADEDYNDEGDDDSMGED